MQEVSNLEILDATKNILSFHINKINSEIYLPRQKNLVFMLSTDGIFQAYSGRLNAVADVIAITETAAVAMHQDAEGIAKASATQSRENHPKGYPDNSKEIQRHGCIPSPLSPEQCRTQIFRYSVLWTFYHELAHATQNHDKFRVTDENSKILEVSSANKEPLRGKSAWISHVTELAADFEAFRHCIRYIIATSIDKSGNPRPEATNWCDIWSLACGVMCLFFRFHGKDRPPVTSEVIGTHPDPIFRARLMVKGLFSLIEGSYSKFFPWNSERDKDGFGLNLAHLLEHAIITAGMYWSAQHLGNNQIPKLFSEFTKSDKAFISYERGIVEIWAELRPKIEADYYGGSTQNLMDIT